MPDELEFGMSQGLNGLTIAIQAGGQSRRMGTDKALLPFLGQPLISRIAARVTALADELLVTANQPEKYAFLGLGVVTDLIPGTGALGGLYTALASAHFPFVAVVGCDMPFLEPQLLRAQYHLIEQENVDVVIPRTESDLEPLHAVYRRKVCLPAVLAALNAGERKMTTWHSSVRVYEMPLAEIRQYDPELLSFFNLNTPEEFREAEHIAQAQKSSSARKKR